MICVLLYHTCCTTASVSTEDTSAMDWIGESGHFTRSRLSRSDELVEQTHTLHRYTRQGSVDKAVHLWNCSRLYDASSGYNGSSCNFIQENCHSKSHLMNYLAFMKCDLPTNAQVRDTDIMLWRLLVECVSVSTHISPQPVGYILLIVWCAYLISLLATTVSFINYTTTAIIL